MSYSQYGLTAREKAIWPPKKKPDGYNCAEAGFWFLIACVGLVTIFHFTIEPSLMKKGTTSIVKEHQLSDAEMCRMATHGVPVHGATVSQLETYCMVHG